MSRTFKARAWAVATEAIAAGETYDWFWLSFTDANRPTGEQFLGVAIVPGPTVVHAITNAHLLGVNPGGAVGSVGLPPEHVPDPALRQRLLSREELRAAGLA